MGEQLGFIQNGLGHETYLRAPPACLTYRVRTEGFEGEKVDSERGPPFGLSPRVHTSPGRLSTVSDLDWSVSTFLGHEVYDLSGMPYIECVPGRVEGEKVDSEQGPPFGLSPRVRTGPGHLSTLRDLPGLVRFDVFGT